MESMMKGFQPYIIKHTTEFINTLNNKNEQNIKMNHDYYTCMIKESIQELNQIHNAVHRIQHKHTNTLDNNPK